MTPYRTTAVFDQNTLPAALRREHRTKAGAWGIIRLLDGQLKLRFPDGREELLSPERPGYVRPEETHWVELLGPMRLQIDFYEGDSQPTQERGQ